jgi:hypothetical protein
MTPRVIAAVAAGLLFLPWRAESQFLVPRVVVVNPPSNPVQVTLAESPSVTVAGPVQVQQASAWSVRIVDMPPVTLAPDARVTASVRTATVRVGISRTQPCVSLYTSQADPSQPGSGRIWLIETVNGVVYAPSEMPMIELRGEAPDPNFDGFTLHQYFLGIHRVQAGPQRYVFNDPLHAYVIRSQNLYPQACFTVVPEEEVSVTLTFTGRLLDCTGGPNACP